MADSPPLIGEKGFFSISDWLHTSSALLARMVYSPSLIGKKGYLSNSDWLHA